MLPLHTLILNGPSAPYQWGAEILSSATESWEQGGVGISDPSGGLTYQLWHGVLEVDTGTVLLDAPNTPQFVLYSEPGITHMDFSFDQNMKPCLSFLKDGLGYFWWYNTVTLQYETVALGEVETPLCLLDDKRTETVGDSDIVLFYLRDGVMYCRDQRDRFTIEYDLQLSSIKRLLRVGFTTGLRVQIQVLI